MHSSTPLLLLLLLPTMLEPMNIEHRLLSMKLSNEFNTLCSQLAYYVCAKKKQQNKKVVESCNDLTALYQFPMRAPTSPVIFVKQNQPNDISFGKSLQQRLFILIACFQHNAPRCCSFRFWEKKNEASNPIKQLSVRREMWRKKKRWNDFNDDGWWWCCCWCHHWVIHQ